MTLREQVMERLFSIGSTYLEGPVDPQLWDPVWTGNAILYGRLADECIRQMQWARSEGMDGDRDAPYEVSIAPEGWKP